MKKEPDYAKLKALHDSILQYIGDAKDTGENPDIPKQEEDIGASGQKNELEFLPSDKGDADEGEKISDSEDGTDTASEGRKKRKDDVLALMGSSLSAKFRKFNEA